MSFIILVLDARIKNLLLYHEFGIFSAFLIKVEQKALSS